MNTFHSLRFWFFALLLAFAGGNAAAQLPAPGPAFKNGVSTCGGLTPNGSLEPPCAATPAVFESAAVGNCPSGSFFDLGTWACYSCPSGYDRGHFTDAIDGPKACAQNTYTPKASTSIKGIFDRPITTTVATWMGTACPAGSFFDPIRGGECYTCPAGHERSIAHVDNPEACVILPKVKLAAAVLNATRPVGLQCPAGNFWDGIDWGTCWACPSGYVRTGNHVKGNDACSTIVPLQKSTASVVGKAACKAGEEVDFLMNPKQGGNCYTCPVNFKRSVFHVNSKLACERDLGYNYAKATLVTALSCPAGQTFDLAGRDTPALVNRINTQNRSGAAVKAVPSKNGATCWSCPVGYVRGLTPIWDGKACDSVAIGWTPPPYTQPGLFGLSGAQEVVQEIIKNDRDLINAIARDYAGKVQDPKVLQLVWEEIRDAPHQSGPLMLIAYSRMLAAADSPNVASAADKALLDSFQRMAVSYRTFLADQAYQAYLEWNPADFKRNEAYRAALIAATVVTFGVAAGPAVGVDLLKNKIYPMPSFPEISLRKAAEGWVSDQTQGFMVNRILLSNETQRLVFRHSAGQAALTRNAVSELGKGFSDYLGALMAERAGSGAATKVTGRMVLAAMKASGPMFLIGLASDAATAWIELHIERANAEKELKAKFEGAKQPISVARLKTPAGRAEVEADWALMMGAARSPVDPKSIRDAAQQVINALPKS